MLYNCIVAQPPSQQSLSLPFAIAPGAPSVSAKSAAANSEREIEATAISDPARRYLILIENSQELEELTPFATVDGKQFFLISVIDSQPSQKSNLDSILETLTTSDRHSLVSAGIPEIAISYLTLAECSPTIPEIWDAWRDEQTEREFLIITKRQDWHSLAEYCQNHRLSSQEILVYLEQVLSLWKQLKKIDCTQTLLAEDNVGIDDIGTLAIRQLYPDNRKNQPQLKQLAETLISLLQESNRPETEILTQLLPQINGGQISDISQLSSTMAALFGQFGLKPSINHPDSEETDLSSLLLEEELENLSDQFDYDEGEEEELTVANCDLDEQTIEEQPTVVLPMKLSHLSESGFTDIGRTRNHNEDCYAIQTEIEKIETPQGTQYNARGLFLVCDGMGGHAAGEVASNMAVKRLQEYFQQNWLEAIPDRDMILRGILQTNEAIYNANLEKGNLGAGRMGTTLVLALIQDNKLAIAHVGDSRIYQVTRKRGLEPLTVDHSVGENEVKHGVERKIAFGRPDAYQLTQALGPRDNNFVHPDIKIMDVKEDTLLLLCSDGISDNQFIENNWQTHLLPFITSNSNLDEGLQRLIDLGNQVNGHDNLTGILVRIKVQPNLEEKNLSS